MSFWITPVSSATRKLNHYQKIVTAAVCCRRCDWPPEQGRVRRVRWAK